MMDTLIILGWFPGPLEILLVLFAIPLMLTPIFIRIAHKHSNLTGLVILTLCGLLLFPLTIVAWIWAFVGKRNENK